MSAGYSKITWSQQDGLGRRVKGGVYRCIYCGDDAQCWDHVIPKSKGGSDEPDNLAPSCLACNTAKSDRPLEYFLRRDPSVLNRVRLYLAGDYDIQTMPHNSPSRTKGTFPEDTPGRSVTFRMSDSAHQALKALAVQERTTTKAIILAGLADQFSRHGLSVKVE